VFVDEKACLLAFDQQRPPLLVPLGRLSAIMLQYYLEEKSRFKGSRIGSKYLLGYMVVMRNILYRQMKIESHLSVLWKNIYEFFFPLQYKDVNSHPGLNIP
jgi:hypothetical protein